MFKGIIMNELERALESDENWPVDCYLENTPTDEIRQHVNEIKSKAAHSTDNGRLKKKIQDLLNDHD